MKLCSKCNTEKPRSEFYKRSSRPCGLQGWCKICQSASANKWNKANRDKTRKTDATWRARNVYRHRDRAKDWYARNPAQVSLNSARQRARKQGVSFTLDKEWMESEMAKGCALTGLPFSYAPCEGKQRPFVASIDRVKAGGNYSKKNCRVVLFCVNTAIGNWGLEAFLPVARALLEQGE